MTGCIRAYVQFNRVKFQQWQIGEIRKQAYRLGLTLRWPVYKNYNFSLVYPFRGLNLDQVSAGCFPVIINTISLLFFCEQCTDPSNNVHVLRKKGHFYKKRLGDVILSIWHFTFTAKIISPWSYITSEVTDTLCVLIFVRYKYACIRSYICSLPPLF